MTNSLHTRTATPSTTLRLSPADRGRVPHVVQLGVAAGESLPHG